MKKYKIFKNLLFMIQKGDLKRATIPPMIMPGIPKILYPIATKTPEIPNLIFLSLALSCKSAAPFNY